MDGGEPSIHPLPCQRAPLSGARGTRLDGTATNKKGAQKLAFADLETGWSLAVN